VRKVPTRKGHGIVPAFRAREIKKPRQENEITSTKRRVTGAKRLNKRGHHAKREQSKIRRRETNGLQHGGEACRREATKEERANTQQRKGGGITINMRYAKRSEPWSRNARRALLLNVW